MRSNPHPKLRIRVARVAGTCSAFHNVSRSARTHSPSVCPLVYKSSPVSFAPHPYLTVKRRDQTISGHVGSLRRSHWPLDFGSLGAPLAARLLVPFRVWVYFRYVCATQVKEGAWGIGGASEDTFETGKDRTTTKPVAGKFGKCPGCPWAPGYRVNWIACHTNPSHQTNFRIFFLQG